MSKWKNQTPMSDIWGCAEVNDTKQAKINSFKGEIPR